MTNLSLVAEYKAARKVLSIVDHNTSMYADAEQIVADLGPREVTYTFPCLLCKRDLDFTTTVEEAADYKDAPRGICGLCADAPTAHLNTDRAVQ